jgi:uncharacterized protein (AIM24 family)
MFNKSRFTSGAAVSCLALILITFLVLLGCPSSTGSSVIDQGDDNSPYTPGTGGNNNSSGGGPTQAEKDAQALADTLNTAAKTTVATVSNGTTVTLTADITIKSEPVAAWLLSLAAVDLELPSGKLTIKSGVTLKVNPDVTVTVEENAIIEVAASGIVMLAAKGDSNTAGGKIVVAARGTVTVKPAGTITLAAGTSSGEGGKIEVKDGATLEVQAEASNKGKVTVQANAVLEVAAGDGSTGGTLKVNGAIEVAADATVEVKGKLEGSVTFTGDGSPDLSEATIDDEATITAGEDSQGQRI